MKLTPEVAKVTVEKLRNFEPFRSTYGDLKDQHDKYTYCFKFSEPPVGHIAISREPNKEGVTVYVNQQSVKNVSFFNLNVGTVQVSEKYSKGYKNNAGENGLPFSATQLSSLNSERNDVLRLTAFTTIDFKLLLKWYLDLPFDQETLRELLINEDYKEFPDNPFEPSSDKPIAEDQLTPAKLIDYLDNTYETGKKPGVYLKTIEKIIDKDRAKSLIALNESEYFKVLTHFAILSKAKRGWFNLFVTYPTRTSKPSLSDNPSPFFRAKDSKELHDAIIHCFYSRLIEGMTEQDKKRYDILLPDEFLPTRLDRLLFDLDDAIQDLFCFTQQSAYGYDKNNRELLPDTASDEAFREIHDLLRKIFNQNGKEEYSTDTLRATLIKFASINRAINDIDAIINIYKEVIDSLPNDIGHLKHIKSESEIWRALSDIFNEQSTNLPKDLIECAKLVCEMHIMDSGERYKEKASEAFNQFSKLHRKPFCIAVSAALLCHDFLQRKKLNLNIRGDTNKNIYVYKMLSDFSKIIAPADTLTRETFLKHGLPEDLLKYFTTRYSVSISSLSDFYPSQIVAKANLNVKRKRFELQREAYELLKNLSVKDACLCSRNFFRFVDTIFRGCK